MSPLSLGLRLLVRGGRLGAIRSISLGLGVAFTVLAALTLLSIPGVATRQAESDSLMKPEYPVVGEGADVEPLRTTYDEVGFEGRAIQRLVIAPTGASPFDAPAWMGEVPAEGEVVVSPALRSEIASDPLAAAMFPGTIIGEIGEDALVAPDTLAAVVGADLADFDPRFGVSGLGRVDPGAGELSIRTLRSVIAFVVLFVLAPLTATSARLSARSTERRLASLRLMGLTCGGPARWWRWRPRQSRSAVDWSVSPPGRCSPRCPSGSASGRFGGGRRTSRSLRSPWLLWWRWWSWHQR